MEQSLKYVKKTYLPDLNFSAGYGYGNIKSNAEQRESNNSFQVGVNLVSEVNIKELYHSIKGADALLNQANNEIDLSEGYISKIQKNAAKELEKFNNELKIKLITKPLLYWDDTVIFVNKKRA